MWNCCNHQMVWLFVSWGFLILLRIEQGINENFVQLTFTIVQCDNICVPCISIYSQVHYHKCSIWQNKEKDDILKRLERERMDCEVGDFEMSTLQHAIMSVILTWTNREGRNGVKKSFYRDLNRLSPTQYSKVLTYILPFTCVIWPNFATHGHTHKDNPGLRVNIAREC